MQALELHITGRRPLLMHAAARLVNPLDPGARELKKITGKRRKTDDDYRAAAHMEFRLGLYMNGHGPYMPGANVEKCFKEAAKVSRQGKDIERALLAVDDADLEYEGPREAEELWEQDFHLSLPVKVGTSKVMRCRGCFQEWSFRTNAILDTARLNLDDFETIATLAGRIEGLGDYRPRYGRFDIKIEATDNGSAL